MRLPEGKEARLILDWAVEEYRPTHVFCMFSGGHDSLCSTHLSMNHLARMDPKVVHINTGIGIEATRQFVRRTCQDLKWELLEYYPPDKTYEDLVLEHGFPGPGAHGYMYIYLKERAIRKLIRDHKHKRMDRILLITGVRIEESVRRMGNVEPIQRIGAQVWVSPLTSWTKLQCNQYIEVQDLPRNEVVDILHMSGECLCGAFAKPGELEWISKWFPEVGTYVQQLSEKVQREGKHATWGTRPPRKPGILCQDCPKGVEDDSN